jgi:Squalene-hopene cyclase C-terminal domain/Prenyltransferase and squalene oxidase repeat
MSWQATSFVLLGLALVAGFGWYERDRPPARVVALVATLAALAVVGRLAFAAVPNVKPTTDIVLFAGYALGAVPGFAVGAVTAVVSNVFLSQGPWTPWQMVGWGAVGVGGAMLARALREREPGRLLLAVICGLAGLAFGAWMDLYQLTLAAHQDLDTYLAISASSLPYNVAHAIGNVVFCLLIGPVFIRALRRYRRRLEVRWAAPAVAAMALLVLLVALPASAGAATAADRAERWLLRAQNADGGFGGAPRQASSPLFSGWSGLGLAAAGHNPRDLRRRGGRSLAAYVERSARSITDIGEIERTVLLVRAAGLSARSFGGRDLVAAIERRRRGDGSIAGFVSYTTFGVLALRASDVSAGRATVRWLVSSQNSDGGFGVAPASASDSDMTGATLQALTAVGRARSGAARRAIAWLRANQNDDGGFGQFRGRSSNAQSTAYAVQGLIAAKAGGRALARALGYLRRLQRRDGSVAYSSSSGQTPVWVTAQALMALEGKPLPLAAVPRAERRPGREASREPKRKASEPAAPQASSGGDDGQRSPPADSPRGDKAQSAPAPAESAEDESGQSIPAPSNAPAPEAAPRDGGLRLDPAGGDQSREQDGGVAGWAIALALLATAGLVVLLRRRLLPSKLRRRLPRRRSVG